MYSNAHDLRLGPEDADLCIGEPVSHKTVEPYTRQSNSVHEKYEQEKKPKLEYLGNTANPSFWGPAYWRSLHTVAAWYPMKAAPLVKERMKSRILAIPIEVPCQSCQHHANSYIESKRDELDQIVSGRHALGKFFVEFHNMVNKRYGKPIWSYEDAYKMYSGQNV